MSKWILIWVGLVMAGCAVDPENCQQLPDDLSAGNAGCLIVGEAGVVLIQQRMGASWAIPGGTAESGERAACTAARETREETGLNVQVLEHLTQLDNGFHIFHCVAEPSQTMQADDSLEIQAVAWKSRAERGELKWRFPLYRAQVEALIQRFESDVSNSSQ